MAIQSLSIAHGFLSAILVGSATFAFLVVLVRGGHLTILTTVVERVHYEFPSTTAHCHCPEPETCSSPSESQALHPKLFQEISALKASESTLQAARAIDWESILLTPNGGFLMVEEFDHQIKGYGVSMFHQLHCLAMVRGMLLGKATSSEHEVDKNWMKDPLHYLHCLDYMTQVSFVSVLHGFSGSHALLREHPHPTLHVS